VVSDVDENGAAERVRWPAALARIEAGRPALWCDSPVLSRTEAVPVHGELRFEGWAVSPGDIDSVTVEVAGRGSFAARTGRRRPDAHKAFYPARWARRPGFEVAIPTTGWLPGILDVTITARDRNGGSASQQGRLAWQPDRADLVGDLAAGLPALWVGEPAGSASEPLSDVISVRGWVSAREGVESVEAELEGLEPARAFLGEQRYEPQDDLPRSYFAIVLDARALDPAQRTLTVRAFAHGGSSTQRSGRVLIDPAARYRRRLAEDAPRASQRVAGPGDAVELHVLVTGGVPGDALLASIDAQERAPADVTSVDGALDGALDRLLSAPGRVGVLVAGGDSLAPHALATVAAHFEGEEPPDLVYSDHDTREAGGDRSGPVLKPGWSPELLVSRPYVGSFLAIGPRAAEAARRQGGSLRSANSLLLALADEPLLVVRVPEVLWSREPGDFPEVSEREDGALDELATRRGSRLAITERDPVAGVRRVEWMLEDRPSVSVVIPTSGREDPLSACLRSLVDRTAYPDLDVVLVDSGGGAAATAKAAGADARVVRYEASGFNFSRACNLGAAQARGDFVAFVNDDIEALDPDWLTCLVAQAKLPNTGIVGAKLIYPGGLVQHAGLFLDRLASASDADLVAAQFAFHQDSDDVRLMNLPRDCSAVTGACLLMRREVLADLGGWDDGFRIDFGDVDLCLRAIEAERRVVVEPRAKLLHHVHATQGQSPHDEDDARRFLDRWAAAYAEGDPWYHPACVFGRDWEVR
jgi:GT2 family glycosyltransferase